MPPILREVVLSILSGLTGYVLQEDDLYFGREALIVHFLGGRYNLATPYNPYRANQGSI
jgi:hypothetical protein